MNREVACTGFGGKS